MGWLPSWLSDRQRKEKNQCDFHAPVDTVNTAVNQIVNNYNTFTTGSPAPSATISPGSLASAALLIDRAPQERAIRNHLSQIKKDHGYWPPVLVALPGDDRASHQTFVTRFGFHDLKQLLRTFGTDDACTHLDLLAWPQGADRIDEVLETFRCAMALPSPYDHPEAFHNWLCLDLPGSICFGYNIDDATWRSDERLIREWVEHVACRWPAPPANRMVLTFLSIEYGKAGSPGLRAFVEELREMAARRPSIVVTPDLGLISRGHLRDWVSQLVRLHRDNLGLVARAQPLPDKIFNSSDQELTFMEVYQSLLTFLDASPHPNSGRMAP